jgi:hypothetical protein
MFVGIGLGTVPLIMLAYTIINRRRVSLMGHSASNGVIYTEEQLRELGDRAPNFHYML